MVAAAGAVRFLGRTVAFGGNVVVAVAFLMRVLRCSSSQVFGWLSSCCLYRAYMRPA